MGVIYCIENVNVGLKYIGKTIQPIEKRWKDHRKLLNFNKHHSRILQKAWNDCGADAFKFYIIENNVDDDMLGDYEAHYVKLYKTLDENYGYNVHDPAKGGIYICSEATKRKLSEALQGENNPMFGRRGKDSPIFGKPKSEATKQNMRKPKSEEHKQRISEAQQCKPKSEAHKRRLSEAMSGKHHDEATKQRISEAKLGKSPSEATKQRISVAKQGENHPQAILTEVQVLEIIELIKQGVPVKEIARRYGVTPSTISRIKNKKTWKHLWK